MNLWREVDQNHVDTGYWAFSKDQASSYVGCKLLLHRSQASRAHIAGTIISFKKQNRNDPYPGRIVFRIENDDTLVGTITEPEGWAMWYKFEAVQETNVQGTAGL